MYQRFTVGDEVEVIGKWGTAKGRLTIVAVGVRSVKTSNGQSWTHDGILWGTGSSMLGRHISKVAPAAVAESV